MKKFVLIITLFALILSGCSYGSNVDEQAFVIAIGLDKGSEYNYRTTFVFGEPAQGGESGKSKKSNSSDIVTLEAPSLYSAVRRLNSLKSKKINITQTKIIVLSDKLAKDGVGDIINTLSSSRNFRPNTLLCVSSGESQKYLQSVSPKQESFVEKYYDHMMKKVASDSVNESYLFYLYFNTVDNSFGSFIPLVGVNEDKLKSSPTAPYLADDFSVNDFAGDIIKESESDAQIGGCAVFKGDKLVAKLGSLYSDISHMLCDEFTPGDYSFRDPQSGKYITIRLLQDKKTQTNTSFSNGNIKIKKEVFLNVLYVDPAGIITTTEKSDEFLDYIEKELEKKTKSLIDKSQAEYKSDFIGLGESAKRLFIDVKSWEEFNWAEKYPTSEIDVSFNILSTDFDEIK